VSEEEVSMSGIQGLSRANSEAVRRIAIGLCAATSLFWGVGCEKMGAGAQSAAPGEHPLLGAAAPAFELKAAGANGKVSPAHAGKVVIVDFWATWCVPCHESFPSYQRLVDTFGGQLVVIGVSVDEDPQGIAAFARDTGAKFPLAWDEGQIVTKSYQPSTMPTSFVIDKHGIVRFVHVGFRSGDQDVIASEVRSLLK
jgi:cytochrome c biogenesis protein CcmG, thiol:disulfide interchange protein DsbE